MHPADRSRYRIEAFRSQDTAREGCDYDTEADTLADARRRARHCVSEEFRQSAEMSAR